MTFHAYARISRDPDNLSEAIERQVADNTKLAERLGWAPLEHLEERNASAWRKTGSRPQFNHLVDLIRAEQTEGVIIWNLDRLLRRVDELEILIKAIEEHPVSIHSAYGQIDLNESDGRAFARMMTTMAQKSSDDTSRRIKRAMQDAPPRERSFAHRPENEAIVKWMVESLLAGATYSWVVDVLNEDGVLTIQGNPWSVTTLGRLMRNKKLVDLIGTKRFVQLQKVCNERAINKGRTTQSNHAYPLTGLVRCAACQGLMIGSGALRPDGYHPRYRCRGTNDDCWNGIDALDLEKLVKKRIRSKLTEGTMTRPTVTTMDPVVADRIAKLDQAYWMDGTMDEARYTKLNDELRALAVKSTVTVEADITLTLDEFDKLTDQELRVRYPEALQEVLITESRNVKGFDAGRVTVIARTQREATSDDSGPSRRGK